MESKRKNWGTEQLMTNATAGPIDTSRQVKLSCTQAKSCERQKGKTKQEMMKTAHSDRILKSSQHKSNRHTRRDHRAHGCWQVVSKPQCCPFHTAFGSHSGWPKNYKSLSFFKAQVSLKKSRTKWNLLDVLRKLFRKFSYSEANHRLCTLNIIIKNFPYIKLI